MIYPTRAFVLLAGAVAPVALVVALVVPEHWASGLGLLALLLALALVDALIGPSLRDVTVSLHRPHLVAVGEMFSVSASGAGALPRRGQAALELSGPISIAGSVRRSLGAAGPIASFDLSADRRGTGRVDAVWLRFAGSLGLIWRQRRLWLGADIIVTPDLRPTRQEALHLASRDLHGTMPRPEQGEGAEFEALADYRPGMDRRAIDWKQSARHTSLIAKEYRIERNNHIVLAIDSGRTMSEPMHGMPRVDSAVSAALLTAFVALKQGDRLGLFAFDAKPRASSKTVSGPGAFGQLQKVAAGIDYSPQETNYTLALATLASGLKRRALIILFTEFTDTVSAELMLAALGPLLGKHLVLFVVLRDAELEGFTAHEPASADDVSRAVTAAGLLHDRRLVIARLRRLGVEVVEAPAAEAGPAVLNAYFDLKRRGRL